MKRFLVLLAASLLVASLAIGLVGVFSSAPKAHANNFCADDQVTVFFEGYNYVCESAGANLYLTEPAIYAVCVGDDVTLAAIVTDVGSQIGPQLVTPGECISLPTGGQLAVLIVFV